MGGDRRDDVEVWIWRLGASITVHWIMRKRLPRPERRGVVKDMWRWRKLRDAWVRENERQLMTVA